VFHKQNREETTRQLRELEAESVSYDVTRRDAGSFAPDHQPNSQENHRHP